MTQSLLNEMQARSVEEQAKHELWYRGDLSYYLRPDGQTRCYDHYYARKERDGNDLTEVVWNCHRRMGKSFLLMLLTVERCLRYPGQLCKFAAPTKQHLQDYIYPIIDFLLQDCPPDMQPLRRGGRMEYVWKNPRWGPDAMPSALKFVGVNVGKGDRLRGQAADFIALDECGMYECLYYVMSSVIVYQFAKRANPAILLATSAPVSIAHEFFEIYVPRAQECGNYMEIRADENTDFTEQDKRIVLTQCKGGEGSTSWKREALCAKISDKESLIAPEFTDVQDDVVVDSYPRPSHFHPWFSIDTGWKDHTAGLHGYVDFRERTLVIESVIWVHYSTLGEIAQLIKDREADLYPPELLKGMGSRVRRIGDMTQLELNNLRLDYGIPIRYVSKSGKDGYESSMEANLVKLRSGIQERRLKIVRNSSTEPLIYQLLHGTWNESRTSFTRPANANKAQGSMIGHCDCIAALAYLWKHLNFRENPFPNEVPSGSNVFVVDFEEEGRRQDIIHAFSNKVM